MKKLVLKILPVLLILTFSISWGQNKRVRDYGIDIGVLQTGKNNAITDVEDVRVGHRTLIAGDSIRTGVTAP